MTRRTSGSARRRGRVAASLSALARFGYAQWFFGNLYEAVVKIPDRLAQDYEPAGADRRLESLFSPGSPVRYYLPAGPITMVASVAALAASRDTSIDRRWLAASTACALSGGIATAYLVRAVNLKLFIAGHTLTRAEQDVLLRTWYRLNAFRLAAAGGAWLASQRARQGRESAWGWRS
jgi:hypothetical protein